MTQMAAAVIEYHGIYRYRTHQCRKDARALHLARMFLKGRAYREVERKCWEPPIWHDIELYVKVGMPENAHTTILQQFAEWRDAAGTWSQPEPKPPRQRRSSWVKHTVAVWHPTNVTDLPAETSINGNWFT